MTLHHDDDHDDHGGLHRDMPHLLERRQALRWMGGVSLAGILAACGVGTTDTTTATPAATSATSASTVAGSTATTAAGVTTTTLSGATTATTTAPRAEIPTEGAGPFPADGTNGPNVLTTDGVFKPDLTTSFGDLSGTAPGVPTTLALTIVDADTGAPMPGAVVYLWHCTADGRYSLYEIDDQNYLRGAQAADDAGRVAFETIFPGCYPGRWPHCHLEVYSSLDEATAGSSAIKTSQLAFPQADCETVYADDRYGNSADSLSRLSLASDGVFADGWTDQLAVISGSVESRLTASLLVRV